jgi:DNA-binding NtrC family response regulator
VPDPTSILLLGGSGTEAARLRRALARYFLLVDVAQDFDEARALTQRCLFHVLVLVDPQQSWGQLQAACTACDGLPSTTLLIVPKRRAESAIAALRGGATDVLLRPFSTDELVASVKALGKSGSPGAGNDQGVAVAPIDGEAGSGEERRAAPPEYSEDWTLEQVKHHHMTRVLEASGGNKSAAARRLGVSRKTLERRLGGGNYKDQGVNHEQNRYRRGSIEHPDSPVSETGGNHLAARDREGR